MDTDLGEGYIKALGNPEGPHALACEFVGSILADWLGLTTLDFSLVEVSGDDEIPFLKGGKALPGPAFISRLEPSGFPWGGTAKQLRSVINPHEISGLVVIDTWTLNYDRHAPDGRRVNRDNVLLIQCGKKERLLAMDFTHAFRHEGKIDKRLSFSEKIRDAKVYGLFPEFIKFLDREHVRQFAARLAQFRGAVAEETINLVPRAWDVNQEGRSAWAKLITERAHFVSETLELALWPQLELEGGTE
ncbi:MAG: HipA family kinase [Terracidiphilus sp.]